jgi:hypothetical protein
MLKSTFIPVMGKREFTFFLFENSKFKFVVK